MKSRFLLIIVLLEMVLFMQEATALTWWDMTPHQVRDAINQRIMSIEAPTPSVGDLQVLINPAPDLTCNGTLERKDDGLDILRWQAIQYLTNPNEASNPYVSPLKATDLTRLPAALVLLAEKDDLREAGQQYADRLVLANVPTQVYCQMGTNHLAGHGARASLQARESLDVAVKAIKEAFKEKATR